MQSKKNRRNPVKFSTIELLEARRLLSGTGLLDAVYHGVNTTVIGGANSNVTASAAYAASTAPNYAFTNTNDQFIYGASSGTATSSFLGADAAGAATGDNNTVTNTIFDAEGWFQTPVANDAGTYTVAIPDDSNADDIVAVYIGGNGTPGSGSLVASSGWQGPGYGGTLSGPRTFTIPAAANSAAPAEVQIEVLYANGGGGANTANMGGTPNTAVLIQDSLNRQVTTYNKTGTNVVTPTLGTGGTGLTDAVYHGLHAIEGILNGTNTGIAQAVAYAASDAPSYTFTNTNDQFIYSGGSGESTPGFLNNDAAGAATNDTNTVTDTIFDAEGYIQTPTANDAGTYTVTLPENQYVDDALAVWIGGNGTPGSGTLVESSGWQGSVGGGNLAGPRAFTIPAGANSADPASVHIEVMYDNGWGGANTGNSGGNNTAVYITDPHGAQLVTYNKTGTNVVTPTLANVGTGLTDAVYHGVNPSVLGGLNSDVTASASYAASTAANYTFTNTNDQFIYGGGSGASTPNFLGQDAAGAATNDAGTVTNTIFDAEGYFQTPTANDSGTYTVSVAGGADDLLGVWVGGNGTPGSGTLVASSGWQGANGGTTNFQFTLPAGPNSAAPASYPIEILYGNGYGGAFINAAPAPQNGISRNTGVYITDSSGVQVDTFNVTATNEILPGAPTIAGTAGNNKVGLTWANTTLANNYSVYRYVTSAGSGTAVLLGSTSTLAYTDNTAVNGTNYSYYITANDEGGSTASNTITATPGASSTAPVTLLTAVRNSSTQVTVSWTAPLLGTNYDVYRATNSAGPYTLLSTAQTATTYTDNAASNVNYYYQVTSVASNNTNPSPAATVFVGVGDGWAADYYTSTTEDPGGTGNTKPLTGDATNAVLAFERIDPTVAALTQNGAEAPLNTPPGFNSIQPNQDDDYAVRWTGYVEAPLTGYYTFGVSVADDREQISVYDPNASAWVNITTEQNPGYTMANYTNGGDTYNAPVVAPNDQGYLFAAGQKYLVQVDYNQGYGGSIANLSWAASSSAANAVAGTYDVMGLNAVPTYDVQAVTPAFSTVDASGTVTKDQSYYTFTATTTGSTTIQLAWNNINADSYNLYRSTSQTGPYTKINGSAITAPSNGAPLTYGDTGLTTGTKYYYILTGVDVNGETPVTLSNGTTSGLTASATPSIVIPATPTNVTAVATNSGAQGVEGHISFPAVTNALSYIIQRAPETSPGSGMPGTFHTVPGGADVTGSGNNTVTFIDNDPSLQATANYFYQVIAVNSPEQSDPSTPVEMYAAGNLKSEGTVEVQVEAAGYGAGTTSTITNIGNVGGTFAAVGGAITVGPVTDSNNITYNAFQFNGANSATSSFNAPTDLTGNSSRSIEIWVDNPTIDDNEETMVSWSHRGGNPDGSNMSFSYGSQYGVGLWGAEYDLTWDSTAPGVTSTGAPTQNIWHYLVFTYDGTNDDVYVDGKLQLQMPVADGGLATFAGFPVNLAAQNSAASGFTAAENGSVDLASVRIENGALTASDVQTNYVVGVPGRSQGSSAPTTAPVLNPLPTDGNLNLTWSYDPNATSYDVYRSDPSHPTPTAIATGLEALSYDDTSVTPGVTYTYYVTSVNSFGQGPVSNTESGSVEALTTAPTLYAPVAGNNSVSLSWSVDPNAATYNVYRYTAAAPTPVAVATGLDVTTYNDATVLNGTAYTYFVTSVNSVGPGPHSNTETVTPVVPGPFAPLNELTHHVDSTNQGDDSSESVLTPTNVNSTDFGKQWEDTLDGGDVIAQPLYMQNVDITTGSYQGIHSVTFIATEADGLYAIDSNTGTILWHDNFTNITDPTNLTPTTGVTTILQSDIDGNPDVGAQLGILATPAINAATGTLYLNANTKQIESGVKHFTQRLWAINIENGQPTMTPALIGDTIAPDGLSTTGPYTWVSGPIINGTGNNDPTTQNPTYPDTDGWTAAPGGESGYVIAFNAIEQMERTAVSLIDGNVYLGFASHGDTGPYYGWILGYSESTLALDGVFNTTPTFEPSNVVGASQPFQSLGGIWGSGSEIATDGTNLYVATGNGAFDGQPSNFNAQGFPIDGDYGDTVLKITPDTSTSGNQNVNGWGMHVSDYFTPSNQFELNDEDLDLGSGGVTMLPTNILDAAGHPMLVAGGKESRVYLIDIDNMGKYNYSFPTGASTLNPAPYDRVVGEYAHDGTDNGDHQIYSIPTYYDGNVYVGADGSQGFELNISALAAGTVVPVTTSLTFGYPGDTFEISSDGTSDGIAWAENPGANDLVAFNAANFSTELYDSNTNGGDSLNGSVHFHVPTVANGMVYAGSRGGGLDAYGLDLSYLDSNANFFSAPTGLSAVTQSATAALISWTSNSSLATEFRVDRAPVNTTNWTTLAYVSNSNNSYVDTTAGGSSAYQYRVVAISGANSTTASNTAVLTPLLPPYITPGAGAMYTWNSTTGALVLTSGTLTFTEDQASSGDTTDPLVKLTASGSNSNVVFESDQHLAGLTLSGGAQATVNQVDVPTSGNLAIGQQVAGNQASDHSVLVIGKLGATADPTFSIDSSSKLNLQDNDLIVHTGSNDSGGYGELTTVQGLESAGRSGGTWNGNELTSSVAEAQDNYDGNETVQLAVVDNNDLGNPFSTWTVGGFSETLGADDIIVKYTYTGDLNLDGEVNFTDSLIFNGSYYSDPATGNEWAQGNIDGDPDGAVGFTDSLIFNGSYNNGTAQAASADDAVLL